jgi:hypothetical protein
VEHIPKYFPQSQDTSGWARPRPHLIIQIVLFHYIRNCTSSLGGCVNQHLLLLSSNQLGPAPPWLRWWSFVQQLGYIDLVITFDESNEPDYTKACCDAAVKVSVPVVRSLKSKAYE